MAFDKDAWILRALKQRVYVAKKDGTIWKHKRTENGKRIYKKVTPSTHKKTGRIYFTMTFEGIVKSVLVNRMVALAHIPNPENKPEVNHKDGVKAHNWESNLEWATRAEQEKHAYETGLKATRGSSNANAKLTALDVEEIRAAPEASLSEIAIMKSVSMKTLKDIRARKTWTHL
jgi:hypothetical protein